MHSNQEYKLPNISEDLYAPYIEQYSEVDYLGAWETMIHHHTWSMYFMFRKCFIFENYIRVKNGNIQCKSPDTFSSEVKYKVEKEQKDGGSALWTGLMHVTFRV